MLVRWGMYFENLYGKSLSSCDCANGFSFTKELVPSLEVPGDVLAKSTIPFSRTAFSL